MALIDITNLGLDQNFRARVQAALLLRAEAIQQEAGTAPNHAQRLVVATAVLHDLATYTAITATAVAAAPAIQTAYIVNHQSSDVTDAQITVAANNDVLWNVLAGV